MVRKRDEWGEQGITGTGFLWRTTHNGLRSATAGKWPVWSHTITIFPSTGLNGCLWEQSLFHFKFNKKIINKTRFIYIFHYFLLEYYQWLLVFWLNSSTFFKQMHLSGSQTSHAVVSQHITCTPAQWRVRSYNLSFTKCLSLLPLPLQRRWRFESATHRTNIRTAKRDYL